MYPYLPTLASVLGSAAVMHLNGLGYFLEEIDQEKEQTGEQQRGGKELIKKTMARKGKITSPDPVRHRLSMAVYTCVRLCNTSRGEHSLTRNYK